MEKLEIGSMITELGKRIWNYITPNTSKALIEHSKETQEILVGLKDLIIKEKAIIEKELLFHKSLAETIFEESPDMVWLKDVEGKYVKANSTTCNKLLLDCNPIGKTDIELANAAREKYGKNNHTFGDKCVNSDKVVLDKLEPCRFLESGKIKGDMVYLEVFKFPFYVDDMLVGVAGIGRDMTDYVVAYRENDCKRCDKMFDVFRKYEFEG